MEAKELRIGNWVIWNNTVCSVWGIAYFIDGDSGNEGWVIDLLNDEGRIIQTPYITNIQPIPLTPGILERCGFAVKNLEELPGQLHEIKVGSKMLWYKDWRLVLAKWMPAYGGRHRPSIESQTLSENIKHLHQLQNLIFALTGEELEVTVPL